MKMKYNWWMKITLLCLIAFVSVRCNENVSGVETGGDIEITDKLPVGTYGVEVSDIEVTAGTKELQVSWGAPEDVSRLGHYIVEWQGQDVDTTCYTAAVTDTEYNITHLYNDTYQVKVYAFSKDLLKSQGIVYTTPVATLRDDEAPKPVQELKVSPVASSVLFTWENPSDDDFDHIVLKVTEEGTDVAFFTTVLQSIQDNYTVVGLKELTTYSYEIITYDYIGNFGEAAAGSFKTKHEGYVDQVDQEGKLLWKVIDFSSEEASGEGGGKTGFAAHAIDNDETTYWHTKWTGGGSSLPQYITIDLNREVMPTMVVIYKRADDGRDAQRIVKIEGCLEEPTALTVWEDLGTFNIDGKATTGQKCNIVNIVNIRYLKITVIASGMGHAMVRNVEVKALLSD